MKLAKPLPAVVVTAGQWNLRPGQGCMRPHNLGLFLLTALRERGRAAPPASSGSGIRELIQAGPNPGQSCKTDGFGEA